MEQQNLEFTEDLSPLKDAGFESDSIDFTHFKHALTLVKPEGWTGDFLLILINAPDGTGNHIPPRDLLKKLIELPLEHDCFRKQFAVLVFNTPLPQRIKYTLNTGVKLDIKQPQAVMQCAWTSYQNHRNMMLLPEVMVTKSLRRLISLLDSEGLKAKTHWVCGYQTWGNHALLARAIPEVSHIQVMGYDQTSITCLQSELAGSGKKEAMRQYALKFIDSCTTQGRLSKATTSATVQLDESIKDLLTYTSPEALKALIPLFADEVLSTEFLELSHPHWMSPSTTESILSGSKDIRTDQVESPRLAGDQVKYRLFTTGKNSELTATDIVEAIRSDMLLHAVGVTPVLQCIVWRDPYGTRSIKLKHAIECPGLSFTNFRVSGAGADRVTDIAELVSEGSEWRAEGWKGRFNIFYVNAHFSLQGLSGRFSSKLMTPVTIGAFDGEPDYSFKPTVKVTSTPSSQATGITTTEDDSDSDEDG